jgi:flagellar hook-associated protein 2
LRNKRAIFLGGSFPLGKNHNSHLIKENIMTTLTAALVPIFNENIVVNNLASSQVLMSPAFSDTQAQNLGTGTITLQYGPSSTFTLTVDSTNNTLQAITAALFELVNNQAFIQVYSGSDGAHMIIGSFASGGANVFSITVSDVSNDNGISGLSVASTAGVNGEMSTISGSTGFGSWSQPNAGQDASITVGGLNMTSPTNTFYNAILGYNIVVSSQD